MKGIIDKKEVGDGGGGGGKNITLMAFITIIHKKIIITYNDNMMR